MFLNILKFELKHWFGNSAFYIYAFTLYVIAFAGMAGAAGMFGEDSYSAGTIANSPLSIYSFSTFLFKLLLILLPAVFGTSVYKDYKNNVHHILYTYPFTKGDYIAAKFISSFTVISIVSLAGIAGLVTVTQLPITEPSQLIPFDIIPYLQTYFIFLLPNLFIAGTVVFAAVLLSRNIYAGFISVIMLWLLKEIAQRIISGNDMTIALIAGDPFGDVAMMNLTKFLTNTEQNSFTLPIHAGIIYNRIVWVSVSMVIYFMTYRLFSLSQNPRRIFIKNKKTAKSLPDKSGIITKFTFPQIKFDLSFFNQLRISWQLSKVDFRFIVSNIAFICIAAAGVIFIIVLSLQLNSQTGTRNLPLTRVMLGYPVFFITFLIQILTFLYAGILVHRAKNSGISDLIAVAPVSDLVLLFSKFLALVKMHIFLLSLIMLTGISIQAYSGFYDFEPGHYLFDLFIIHLMGFMIWAFAALLIQTIFNNTYFAFFLLILISLGISQLPSFGIESFVFRFNESPYSDFYLKYSDINGYGHPITPYFIYKAYWLMSGLIMFCTTLLFLTRELTGSFKERLRIAGKRFKRSPAVIIVLSVIFIAAGLLLYRNENSPENKIFSVYDEAALLTEFRKKYDKYKFTPQPRITTLFFQLDIFPETNSFRAEGKYTLKNTSLDPVDTLLIRTGFDEITEINFNGKAMKITDDSAFKFSVYKLDRSLELNDSIELSFTIKNKQNTLFTQHSNVLQNGTYLKSDIFPRLGYFAGTDKKMPDDTTADRDHYQSIDADLIGLECIVSTSPDQTAVAPGNLQRQWNENNRSFYHYKMDKPVKFVFGINSGKFDVAKEMHNDIELTISYHPAHDYSTDRMMEGMKASLDYNQKYFGAYPHRQINIIEFPVSEGTYATTAANCIQTSEARFINDTSKGMDISFYVTAHELAHQWWGNIVIPADALGAGMITESVAEFIAVKVYEKKYGRENALKFLDNQLNRYLSGRSEETGIEPPLYLASIEQTYITYGRGAVAFYTMSEFIGEENLNRALKNFMKFAGDKSPLYVTSVELLSFIKKETPENLQYLITDMFETNDAGKLESLYGKIRVIN